MKSVDVTAGTLEYREEGDPAGPPVVLLHGLLMNDAQWNLALPASARRISAICCRCCRWAGTACRCATTPT